MNKISKIQLPSGAVYEIADTYARELIAGGVQFVLAWDGNSVPVVTEIPAGVKVSYNGQEYTGTLSADDANAGSFYLVKSGTNAGQQDIYDEYVVIGSEEKSWEKIGDTQLDLSSLGELAYKDSVSLSKGDGDNVLGEATTFTASASAVSFTGGANDNVLGEGTTFTATGTEVEADGTANAITGFGAHTKQTFVKSVSADTTKKLVTASIVPTNGSDTVHDTPTLTKSSVGSASNWNAGSASSWNFAIGSGSDAETLVITGANSTAPSLTITDTQVGTGLTEGSAKTFAKVGSAVTVATGSATTTGTGSAIVTDVTIGESAEAITALGTPTTAAALTGVRVSAQPTINVGSDDLVSAVTNVGTATAAAQTITVGSNDKVAVARYGDLGVSVA